MCPSFSDQEKGTPTPSLSKFADSNTSIHRVNSTSPTNRRYNAKTSNQTTTNSTIDASPTTTPTFYKFDIGNLPDELFHAHIPVSKWLETCETTSQPSGFAPNSLNQIHPIPWDVELERIAGLSLYQFLNVLPFLILPLVVLYWVVATPWSRGIVYLVAAYVAVLSFFVGIMEPVFLKRYRQSRFMWASMADVQRNQYVYTERNTTKYLSVKFVWPRSVQRPRLEQTPVLFCIVPHGVVTWGIAAYPLWSKLWNDRICRWSIAPVVLKLPIVNYLARKVGYIPAKAQPILETLTKRQENVGLVLDGIAGMFTSQHAPNTETAFVKQRKGIVKIALKAGVPIVPVYGFGHTSLYTVCVDPFGFLEQVSRTLEISVTPFLGRWGWLLGPPRRVPVTVCLGEPVMCPQVDRPTQDQIDEYHGRLLQAYHELFETHKEAYGWADKKLQFV